MRLAVIGGDIAAAVVRYGDLASGGRYPGPYGNVQRACAGVSAVLDGVFHNGLQGQRRQAEEGVRRVVFDKEAFAVLRLLHGEIGAGVFQLRGKGNRFCACNGGEVFAQIGFDAYLKSTAELMPPECPLVLNIIGNCLSREEQKTVEETIRDDLAYDLGVVEKKEKRHTQTFFLMLAGMLLSGGLLWFTKALADEPRELLYILFWFAGETLCDYLFLTGYELRCERRLAGRLASIKIVFSESYEMPNYTQSEVDELYSEIKKSVGETIRGKD